MSLITPSIDLARHPDARRVRKRPIPVQVRFAESAGTLDTLEGPVRHEAGAALLTGGAGERWPVERGRFDATYEPLEGTVGRQPGEYRKKPLEVLARQLRAPEQVRVGSSGSLLSGKPGDWLVEYGPGDFGIVAADIFDSTYDLLDKPR